ncbi:MAG TPA: DUF2905 family protein [Chloroflexota bacterium]
MGDLSDLGRTILLLGAILVVVGLLLTLAGRIPLLGRLPGDIVIERGNLTCAVPIATSILLSLLLTLILNVLARLGNR